MSEGENENMRGPEQERPRQDEEKAEDFKKGIEKKLIHNFVCTSCGSKVEGSSVCSACQKKDFGFDRMVTNYILANQIAEMKSLSPTERVKKLKAWYFRYSGDEESVQGLSQSEKDEIQRVSGGIDYSEMIDVHRRLAEVDGVVDGDPDKQKTQEYKDVVGDKDKEHLRKDVRERYLRKLEGSLKDLSRTNIIDASQVRRILKDIGASDDFEEEALAMAVLFQRSFIKSDLVEDPVRFTMAVVKDKDKMPPRDVEQKVDIFLAGHENSHLLTLLNENAASHAQIGKAWKIYTDISRGEDVGGGDLIRRYVEMYRAKIKDGKQVIEGIKNKDVENGLVAALSAEFKIDPYEARIGFILFEAFVESKYNPNHPLYGVNHPQERFDPYTMSPAWQMPEIIGGRRKNGFPEKLWEPTAFMDRELSDGTKIKLSEAIATEKGGIEALLKLLQDDKIIAEGLMSGNLADARAGIKIIKTLGELGPTTSTDKLNKELLLGLKTALSKLEPKKYFDKSEVVRVLSTSAKVMFWELSAYSPAGMTRNEKGAVRALDLGAMLDRYLEVATLRDEGGGKYVGLFEFEQWGIKGQDVLEVLETDVRKYMRKFYHDYRNELPEGQQLNGVLASVEYVLPGRYIKPVEFVRLRKEARKKRGLSKILGGSDWKF